MLRALVLLLVPVVLILATIPLLREERSHRAAEAHALVEQTILRLSSGPLPECSDPLFARLQDLLAEDDGRAHLEELYSRSPRIALQAEERILHVAHQCDGRTAPCIASFYSNGSSWRASAHASVPDVLAVEKLALEGDFLRAHVRFNADAGGRAAAAREGYEVGPLYQASSLLGSVGSAGFHTGNWFDLELIGSPR